MDDSGMVRKAASAARRSASLVDSRRIEVRAGEEGEDRASCREGRVEDRRAAAETKLEEAGDQVSALEKVTVELTKQLDNSKADVDGRVEREAQEDKRTTEALALFAALRDDDADARANAITKLETLLKSLV